MYWEKPASRLLAVVDGNVSIDTLTRSIRFTTEFAPTALPCLLQIVGKSKTSPAIKCVNLATVKLWVETRYDMETSGVASSSISCDWILSRKIDDWFERRFLSQMILNVFVLLPRFGLDVASLASGICLAKQRRHFCRRSVRHRPSVALENHPIIIILYSTRLRSDALEPANSITIIIISNSSSNFDINSLMSKLVSERIQYRRKNNRRKPVWQPFSI